MGQRTIGMKGSTAFLGSGFRKRSDKNIVRITDILGHRKHFLR